MSTENKRNLPRIQTPRKKPPLRRGIVQDAVSAKDFLELDLRYACEQCSHFDPLSELCTFGHQAENHKMAVQLKNYELTGRLAICRNLEID